MPKTKLKQAIPGLEIEHEWPCYGVMDLLVLDNGLEFHGIDLESVAFDLAIRLQYCPKHAPQFKGTIERHLKTVNYFFAHQLPGTSMSRLQERGDYDPAKHAVLTLAEFKYVFEKWLLDIYAQNLDLLIDKYPGMVDCKYPRDDVVEQLFQHIGLLQRLGKEPRKQITADNVVNWHFASGTDATTNAFQALLLQHQDAMGGEITRSELYDCMSEAVTNTRKHA